MYNYTWDKHAEGDYSTFGEGDKQTMIPARIPITALAAGASSSRLRASTARRPHTLLAHIHARIP
jgi:hypothetical protein